MKTVMIFACSTAVIFLTAAFVVRSAYSEINLPEEIQGFAVLELFTSEGCSSCPAADALLARIQETAGDKLVYVLTYHVDYWDRLGWRDTFSNPLFSTRQRQYSAWLNNPQIYTPQVVINGKTECVGSDEATLTGAINSALRTPVSRALSLQVQQQGEAATIDYRLDNDAADSQLLIAIIQKQAVTQVKRGENGGRTLHHVSIVHNLYTVNLTHHRQGTENLFLPEGFSAKDWEIIGLVQRTKTGEIIAASRAAMQ